MTDVIIYKLSVTSQKARVMVGACTVLGETITVSLCLQFTQKPVLPVSLKTDNPGDKKDGSLSISAVNFGPGMSTFDVQLQSLPVPAWGVILTQVMTPQAISKDIFN